MKTITYRKLKAVNIGERRRDLISSRLADRTTPVDLDELVHAYDDILASLTERHAPLRTRTLTNRPRTPWFNDKRLLGRDAVLNENGKGLVFMNTLSLSSVQRTTHHWF